MASGRRVGQRPNCHTFLCKFWHFQMALSQWKLPWLTPNLGILWISVCSFRLCESIVANPIIYRIVPRPSRFEIRQCMVPACSNIKPSSHRLHLQQKCISLGPCGHLKENTHFVQSPNLQCMSISLTYRQDLKYVSVFSGLIEEKQKGLLDLILWSSLQRDVVTNYWALSIETKAHMAFIVDNTSRNQHKVN